ncbi:MAG: DNA repair protein RecN [Bacillota bacterium]
MLVELSISDFALIDSLRLSFSRGLNVLTGETGAGKSIVIDGMELALGGRASADMIRSGCERARIEVLFDVGGDERVAAVLEGLGLEAEGGHLLLSRELAAGKSTCRLNGRMVTGAMLREISQYLLDLHGQHEHQSLLKPDHHLDLLDSFGGPELLRLRGRVAALHERRLAVQGELKQLIGDERDQARRLDLYQFQLSELDAANLRVGEDEELAIERRRLVHGERLAAFAQRAHSLLYAGEGGAAAIDQVGAVLSDLRELAAIDPRLAELLALAEPIAYQIEDLSRGVRRYGDELEFNPGRLDEVERRLDTLAQLKRKYGNTIEDMLAYRAQVAADLERLANAGGLIAGLQAELGRIETELADCSFTLSEARRAASVTLAEGVMAELADLGMERTVFLVFQDQAADPAGLVVAGRRVRCGPRGIDQVEFLLSPNQGEPPKPLTRIASGGELSRIMLALKCMLAEVDAIPTLIFDEVDAGVGGRAAAAVAAKLATLGQRRQVLCVTHLPVIAAAAASHLSIAKTVEHGRTVTRVRPVTGDERVAELVRMLGGDGLDGPTADHARALLKQAG